MKLHFSIMFATAIPLMQCATIGRVDPVLLDESACDKDRMFPPEYAEGGIYRNYGQPPRTHQVIRDAHVKCHNAERDTIEANQRVIERMNSNRPTAKDRLLDGVMGAALWTLVIAGIAVSAGSSAAPLLLLLL